MAKKLSLNRVDAITVGNNHDDLLCHKASGKETFECIARKNSGADVDAGKGAIDGVRNVVSAGFGVTTFFHDDDGGSNFLLVPVGKKMDCKTTKGPSGERDLECKNVDVG